MMGLVRTRKHTLHWKQKKCCLPSWDGITLSAFKSAYQFYHLTWQHKIFISSSQKTLQCRVEFSRWKIYLYTWECRYSICLHYKRSAGFQPTNNLIYKKTEGVCRPQNSCQFSARFAVLRDLDKKLKRGRKLNNTGLSTPILQHIITDLKIVTH